LAAAASHADAGAGQGNVGATTQPCSSPTPSPTPTPVPTATLWVRIALTQAQAANESGSLRLQGSTGGFNQTIPIASSFLANDDISTVDVPFQNVPTSDNYSLIYIGGDGTETTVVKDTPFQNLQDSSPPA
jgi:hypothetical protein